MAIKCKVMAVFVLVVGIVLARAAHAEEKKQDVKGLDIVSDTAVAILKKADAFLNGQLEITMSKEGDKSKIEKDYTTNVLGQKVPKATAVKSGRALLTN